MKYLILLICILAISCNPDVISDNDSELSDGKAIADSLARIQAIQDSIALVVADSLAELQAIQDSLAQFETLTDIDGNVYKAISIGNQVWMVDNLRTTKFNDGSPIKHIQDNAEWFDPWWDKRSTLTTWYTVLETLNDSKPDVWYNIKDSINKYMYEFSSYGEYENDSSFIVENGRLYTWFTTVAIEDIAPDGWHVPTESEWIELETYLSENSEYYEYFKEYSGRRKYTDSSNNSDSFVEYELTGYWWASTDVPGVPHEMGHKCRLRSEESVFTIGHAAKNSGFSIRLVKD